MIRHILLVTGLLLLSAAFVAAQNPKELKPANKRELNTKILQGKIAAIRDDKITIENDYGAKKDFKMDGKTKFWLQEKKRVKADEVKPGVLVNITYRTSDATVTRVQETIKKFKD